MKRTIRDAVADLPQPVREHLLHIWRFCLFPDIYDGDLEKYLTVIEQEMKAALYARYALNRSVPLLRRVIELIQPAVEAVDPPPRIVTAEEVNEQAPYAGSAIIFIQGRRVFCLPDIGG